MILPTTFAGRVALRLLTAFGWQLLYRAPSMSKAVITFYPHTSNWDFVVGILARTVMALQVRFIAKESLFVWPFGALFRRLGGIAVKRGQRANQVAALAREFDKHETFYLLFAPEGTRRKTDSWRSGFYRLALALELPVGLAFIDYAKREIGVLEYLSLSGDETLDLARISAAYLGRSGKYPGQQSPIAFIAANDKP